MPEQKDRTLREGGGGAEEELAGGLFIGRVMSPAAVEAAKLRPRRVRAARRRSPEEDPENQLPARRKKSVLPEWYPRLPLQDITHIVSVLEKRRTRIRAAQAQQRNLNSDAPISSPQEQNPRGQRSITGAQTTFPTQHQQNTGSTTASSSILQAASDYGTLITSGSEPTKPPQKLFSLMDGMEKEDNALLKNAAKGPARKVAQKTLLSLR